MMEVQGSGYVDFGDGSPLNFFGYAGKNGHAYKSIGKVLVDRGEVPLSQMYYKLSMIGRISIASKKFSY